MQVCDSQSGFVPLPASWAQAIKESQAEPLGNRPWRNHSEMKTRKDLWPGQGLRAGRWGAGRLPGLSGWGLMLGVGLAFPTWPGPGKQVFSVCWTCQKASVSLASGRAISPPAGLAEVRCGVDGLAGTPLPPALSGGWGESGVHLGRGVVMTI